MITKNRHTEIAENRTGSMNLKWEVSTKTNFGIDARFFDDKVDMTVDFFHTKTTDIFQRRANIPELIFLSARSVFKGISLLFGNLLSNDGGWK